MTQRNPLNERYQNTEERTGKTRKSAASAKPVSKAAASVRTPGTAEQPKGLLARATAQANKSSAVKESKKRAESKQTRERREEQALRSKYYNPDTPEYKKWRKVWWGMLGGAILCVVISFLLSSNGETTNVSWVLVILSYVLLIAAIVFDFTYIRRLRTEYQDQMIAQERSKKNSAKRKEAAAAARAAAQAAEDAETGDQPEEERKPFRGLFTRKRAADAVATAKTAQARAVQGGADAPEASADAVEASED